MFARARRVAARLLASYNLVHCLTLRQSVARASQSRTTVIWGVAKAVWSPGSLSGACSRARNWHRASRDLGPRGRAAGTGLKRLRKRASERYRWTILDGGIHTRAALLRPISNDLRPRRLGDAHVRRAEEAEGAVAEAADDRGCVVHKCRAAGPVQRLS